MRYRKSVSTVIVFLSFFVLPVPSFSEVKIFLSNGRVIMADSCRDTKDKLICEKMGGTFAFDKAEIMKTENITIERSTTTEVSPADTQASDVKQEAPQTGEVKSEVRTNAEAGTGSFTPEQTKRIDEIEKKRSEYTAEREKLAKEREQLHAEVKAVGVIQTQAKYDEIQKKISDLDIRIKAFNDSVNKLNEEISGLTKEVPKKTQ